MGNTLKKDVNHNTFTWENLGDIKKSRVELGEEMPVMVYRLMQYTMLDILSKEHGNEKANEYFRQAGYLAGIEFAKNMLPLHVELSTFIASLQNKMKELKIGILRIEFFDEMTGEIILTIEEDLDCSGIPITNETVCYYDEGFIAGVLEVYMGMKYTVREIDCWANGNRVCRFHGKSIK